MSDVNRHTCDVRPVWVPEKLPCEECKADNRQKQAMGMLRVTGSGGSATAQFHRQAQTIGNPDDLPKIERGWLIEKRPPLLNSLPQWLIASWTFEWTNDSTKAIRFCRREDAEQIASMLESEPVSIAEHQWG